ncbi:MAG: hypothetical protein ACK4JY_04550 [Brevundimonas sp.]|uniref:hypothetical protein n=1 Tax=Brevundimonas sp. TaxID=1871086 RepID=UPI00391C8411
MRFGMSIAVPALLAAAALSACSESEEPRNAAINEDLNTGTTAAQTEGANSFTEGQARGHVENAGYTDVSPMTLTEDGLWQGTATRDGATMNVSVDYRGAVTNTPEQDAPPAAANDGDTAAPSATDQGAPAAATVSQDPAAMPGATSAEMRRTGERG